jgi:hypothetical protein
MKLRRSFDLKSDWDYYDRLPLGHADRTYQFLMDALSRAIQRQQRNRNREQDAQLRTKGFANPGEEDEAAPKKKNEKKSKSGKGDDQKSAPAQAKPKEKGKAKSSGKKDGKSERGRSEGRKPSKGGGRGGSDSASRGSTRSEGSKSSRSNGSKSSDGKKEACWYFNINGSCRFDDRCHFHHRPISAKEKAKLKRPDRSSSPAAPGKGSGGKGDGKKDTRGGIFCVNFLKPGGCSHGENCRDAHLDEKGVAEIQRTHRKAKKD